MHLKKVSNKLIPLIKILTRQKYYLNNKIKILIYKNLFLPKATYASNIWLDTNKKITGKINSLNKYMAKIFKKNKNDTLNQICKEHKIIKINDYYKLSINLDTVKKLVQSDHEINRQKSNRINTINDKTLNTVRRKTEFAKSSVLNKRIKEFNEIPKNIKATNNIKIVKKKLVEYYINSY